MQIPLITIERGAGKDVLTSNVEFNGWHISSSEEMKDIRDSVIEIVEKHGKGSAVVMADVESLRKRKMDITLLKTLRTKKVDIWLITYVEDADDLFDAFYMNIDTLVVPYHFTTSDAALKEMNSVSDSTMPLIFTNGNATLTRTGEFPLHDVLRNITEMGFFSIAVMDVSGEYDEDMWSKLHSEFERIIPFIRGTENASSLENIGFTNVVTL